jgi:4-aminobutyrate aminotransferase-like enzyme
MSRMTREAVRRSEACGLLMQASANHSRSNVLWLVPPMVSTDAEIDRGLTILDEVFDSPFCGSARPAEIAAN